MNAPGGSRRVPRLGLRGIELRTLVERTREVVLLAALTGAITGVLVALFDRFTGDVVFDAIVRAPRWVQVGAPLIGLVLTSLVLRFLAGGASPSTADEYVKAMTGPEGAGLALRPVVGRVVASIATLGSGGALGFEGPSLYLGAAIGEALRSRLRRLFQGVDPQVALVAGAAAGVAAIFKAPATGAVFALEVPFQDDLARRSLMPALVGAASGYLTFVAINGTNPLIPVSGTPALGWRELAGAALVGVLCGVGARLFAVVVRLAKRIAAIDVWWRPVVAGAVAAGLVGLSIGAFHGETLTLGPGYRTIDWSLDPRRTLWLIALLATARVAATATTLAGGGVGGLFVPLVVQGALSGRLVAGLVGGHDQSLYVVLGIAAFLGAGYRVPLAAVMFVAEATGRPGFVVPGLIAAVVAQLLMGAASVSPYQQRLRAGHLEERAELPIASALTTDTATAAPDDSVAQFFTEHVSLARRRAVPVVADGRFVGVVQLDDVLALDHEAWATTRVADVMRTDGPVGRPDWTLGDALAAMVDADVENLPVVDAGGALRGLVTSQAILDLDRLMDELADPRSDA